MLHLGITFFAKENEKNAKLLGVFFEKIGLFIHLEITKFIHPRLNRSDEHIGLVHIDCSSQV